MTNIYTTSDLRSPAPKRPSFFRRHRAVLIVGAAALILGAGIGAAGEPEPVTIEKTVPGPERVVTKTVKVTPEACITALDLAQQGFTYSAESMGYMNDALQAAGKFNVAGLEQANADMKAVNPKIAALTGPMKAATAECRASAK